MCLSGWSRTSLHLCGIQIDEFKGIHYRTSLCAHLNFLVGCEEKWKNLGFQAALWGLGSKDLLLPHSTKFWPRTKQNLGINLSFVFLVIMKIVFKFEAGIYSIVRFNKQCQASKCLTSVSWKAHKHKSKRPLHCVWLWVKGHNEVRLTYFSLLTQCY